LPSTAAGAFVPQSALEDRLGSHVMSLLDWDRHELIVEALAIRTKKEFAL
jgi:hypothetical protein